jgi:hypothetical protein
MYTKIIKNCSEEVIENIELSEQAVLKLIRPYAILIQTEDCEYDVWGFDSISQMEEYIMDLEEEQTGWFISGIYKDSIPLNYKIEKTLSLSIK